MQRKQIINPKSQQKQNQRMKLTKTENCKKRKTKGETL